MERQLRSLTQVMIHAQVEMIAAVLFRWRPDEIRPRRGKVRKRIERRDIGGDGIDPRLRDERAGKRRAGKKVDWSEARAALQEIATPFEQGRDVCLLRNSIAHALAFIIEEEE